MNKKEKEIYEARAKVIKALAHPTRLWIVDKLSEGERCVCEFVDKIDADFSTVSKHLSVLKQAGIIDDEKRGKQVYYTLRVPCILKFIDCANSVLKSNALKHMRLTK